MRTIDEINKEIQSLEERLKKVKGTQTEVYTRIVGYHRNIDNWNKGKREEYNHRKVYKVLKDQIEEKNILSKIEFKDAETENLKFQAKDVKQINPENISFYKIFTSQFCRNCPPVKDFVSRLPFKGEEIDVTTDLGINASTKFNIMSTPTVLFFDTNENVVFQAHAVNDIRNYLTDKEKVLV
ncbi:MAG: hypothetical protein JXB50_09195 [Spirochaetes bacterium]|nr:hypothetical protein [Spirochaetota bacterium]